MTEESNSNDIPEKPAELLANEKWFTPVTELPDDTEQLKNHINLMYSELAKTKQHLLEANSKHDKLRAHLSEVEESYEKFDEEMKKKEQNREEFRKENSEFFDE